MFFLVDRLVQGAVWAFDWSFEVVCSFFPSEWRRRLRPSKVHSDDWYEFKRYVLYPAIVIEFFFCSSFMHRPLFITVYVIPPIIGILWSSGFISPKVFERCALRVGTAFLYATRGHVRAILALAFGVCLFFSFFILCWSSPTGLWFLPFIFTAGFWFRALDFFVTRELRKRWTALIETDQGYFFSMFDSYDFSRPSDILFDRDLARLGSSFFYCAVVRHDFYFYVRVLTPWLARLGAVFYLRVLRLFERHRVLRHTHPRYRVLARQGRRVHGTTPYGLFYFFDPYFRLFSLGFTRLFSFLPGLYVDAAHYAIKGIGGGRAPKQRPGAADFQLYREFEPHHIRDMCFGYYELPWGENHRESRDILVDPYGLDYPDRLRSASFPSHVRTWPRAWFLKRVEWWALYGVDWRGDAGWDAYYTRWVVSYLSRGEKLHHYLYDVYRAMTPRLLSYFYLGWHRLFTTHLGSHERALEYAQALDWGDSLSVRVLRLVRDTLVRYFNDFIGPRDHNYLPILLREGESRYTRPHMNELLHYTDPFSEYLVCTDVQLAHVPVLTFNTDDEWSLQAQREFFARTVARAHEAHAFSYDVIDLAAVASLLTYWTFRLIPWWFVYFFIRVLRKTARRQRKFFFRPNFDYDQTDYFIIVPQVFIKPTTHRWVR